MTEPRRALYAHLLADSGVQTAVGDRIYQGRVPAGATKAPDFDPASDIAGASARLRRRGIQNNPHPGNCNG